MLADYVMKSIDNLFQQKLSLKSNNKNNTSKLYNQHNSITDTVEENDYSMKDKNKHQKTSSAFFNKEYIKENLHRVIKKNSDQDQSKYEKSPFNHESENNCIQLRHMKSTCEQAESCGFHERKLKKSVSPISKSRLKLILQHNKQQRIRSVVKIKKDHSQSKTKSPYTKIEDTISQLSRVTTIATIPQLNLNDISINQYNSDSNKKNTLVSGMNIDKKDKITYYRQQRKDLSKSKSRSKIFIQNQQESIQQNKQNYQLSQISKSRKTPSKQTQIYRSRSKIFKNSTKIHLQNDQAQNEQIKVLPLVSTSHKCKSQRQNQKNRKQI